MYIKFLLFLYLIVFACSLILSNLFVVRYQNITQMAQLRMSMMVCFFEILPFIIMCYLCDNLFIFFFLNPSKFDIIICFLIFCPF